jgi:hypothetical protein
MQCGVLPFALSGWKPLQNRMVTELPVVWSFDTFFHLMVMCVSKPKHLRTDIVLYYFWSTVIRNHPWRAEAWILHPLCKGLIRMYYFRLVLDLRLLGVLSTNMELAGNSSMNCTSRRKKLYNVRWKWRKRNWRLRWNMLAMNMKLRFLGNVSFIELEFQNVSFDIYCIDPCIGYWIFIKIVPWFALQFLLAYWHSTLQYLIF